MYTLIQPTKETKTSIFFQGEHLDNGTFATIEIVKDEIQNYLWHCDQDYISDRFMDNVLRHEDIYDYVFGLAQAIVFGGKESHDYFVLKSEKSTFPPKWETPCRLIQRIEQSALNRNEVVVDGYKVKSYSCKVEEGQKLPNYLLQKDFAPLAQ